jgi:hypothetical protein
MLILKFVLGLIILMIIQKFIHALFPQQNSGNRRHSNSRDSESYDGSSDITDSSSYDFGSSSCDSSGYDSGDYDGGGD